MGVTDEEVFAVYQGLIADSTASIEASSALGLMSYTGFPGLQATALTDYNDEEEPYISPSRSGRGSRSCCQGPYRLHERIARQLASVEETGHRVLRVSRGLLRSFDARHPGQYGWLHVFAESGGTDHRAHGAFRRRR